MIELTVLEYLKAALPEPVYMEAPNEPPKRYYLLRKADSGREDLLDNALFSVVSHAESLLEAAQMNEAAKAAMDALVELDAVAASSRAGDYPFPDLTAKNHRYQTLHNITHY